MPTSSTRPQRQTVRPGDILVLREDSLNEIDYRSAGHQGDRMHARAVARQEQLERQEAAERS